MWIVKLVFERKKLEGSNGQLLPAQHNASSTAGTQEGHLVTTQLSATPNNASSEIVAMNYRYAAAWNEVNTRIAQRQNALLIFVTVAGAMLTFITAKNSNFADPVFLNIFSVVLPIFSVAVAFLNFKHDRTIALLRDFMAECESLNAREYPALRLVRYNSSPFYREEADRTRSLHDWTCFILILVFNLLVWIALLYQFDNSPPASPPAVAHKPPVAVSHPEIWQYIVCWGTVFLALFLVVWGTTRSHRFNLRNRQEDLDAR